MTSQVADQTEDVNSDNKLKQLHCRSLSLFALQWQSLGEC